MREQALGNGLQSHMQVPEVTSSTALVINFLFCLTPHYSWCTPYLRPLRSLPIPCFFWFALTNPVNLETPKHSTHRPYERPLL